MKSSETKQLFHLWSFSWCHYLECLWVGGRKVADTVQTSALTTLGIKHTPYFRGKSNIIHILSNKHWLVESFRQLWPHYLNIEWLCKQMTLWGHFKFAFHCQEIFLSLFTYLFIFLFLGLCFSAQNMLTTQSPHVLKIFNPSESRHIKMFVKVPQNPWHTYPWIGLQLTKLHKLINKWINVCENRLSFITAGYEGCWVLIGSVPARQTDGVWRSDTVMTLCVGSCKPFLCLGL